MALLGQDVPAAPADSRQLYDEARRAASAGAFAPAVMACRKVIMHVAVEKGAEPKLTFAGCVEWLHDQHWLPPNGRGWVDYIRKRGNEANHEIVSLGPEDAAAVISLTQALLQHVYQLPSMIPAVK